MFLNCVPRGDLENLLDRVLEDTNPTAIVSDGQIQSVILNVSDLSNLQIKKLISRSQAFIDLEGMRNDAERAGVSNLTDEEIQAEIDAYRRGE